MEDLQTYRARIGLFRQSKASKQNVSPYKQEQRLNRECGESTTKLNPVATSGKMFSGIKRLLAVILITILFMTDVTSSLEETSFPSNLPESHVIVKCSNLGIQQNYDVPSSTCDCLLGNANVHAYNGNPRTPDRDDESKMDLEADADPHSAGPSHKRSAREIEEPFSEHSHQPRKLQKTPAAQMVQGDDDVIQESIVNLSERANKIQQLEITIREKHSKMIEDLNGYISPMLPETWERFQNGLTPYLPPREIYGSDVKFVGKPCASLMRRRKISYGEYKVLLEIVTSVDEDAGEIIKRTTADIEDINRKISDLKPQVGTSNKKRPAHELEDVRTEYSDQSIKFPKLSPSPIESAVNTTKRDNMISQTEKWIKQIRQNTTYITTNAFNVAVDMLKKSKFLLIKGNCGDGKSALAIEIMAWLMGDREEQFEHVQSSSVNQEKKPILLKELKSWDETISCNENLAIFIDDIFGYDSIYSEDLPWWKKILPFIRPVLDGNIETNANVLIVTVRNDIYSDHRSLFSNEDIFTATESVVDLNSSQRLQTEEKKRILRLYLAKVVKLLPDDETAIVQSDLPYGFPECCRIFKSLVAKDLHHQPREYFLRPLAFIKHIIRDKFSESKKAALFFLLLAKEKVTVNQLESVNLSAAEEELIKLSFSVSSWCTLRSSRTDTEVQTKRNIKERLESLIGSLVKFEFQTYTFYNDVVQDAVALLFGDSTLTGFIEKVNISHLRYISTLPTSTNVLYVADVHLECLYSRILDELKSRETKRYNISTTLQVWDDQNFVRNFVAWVRKQESVPNDFYFQWKTDECASGTETHFSSPHQDDKSTYYSFFVYVAKSNKECLLQHLIQQGQSNTTQMKLALDQACLSESEKCALKLLEYGITPDSNTWKCIVKGGSLVLLDKLISSNIYPDATTDDKTFNVENVNMLQLACLNGKEQTALRLAQHSQGQVLLKHRDKDGNSVFHHIVMTNNSDLFRKIATCLKPQDLMSLLKREDGTSVLHMACLKSEFNSRGMDMVIHLHKTYPALLLEKNHKGWHCLHMAAFSGDVDCFRYLDNSINQYKSYEEKQHYMKTLLGSKGESVLHIASLSGKKIVCTYLFKMYPSLISQRDSRGRHCLQDAAKSGDVDCFIYLDNLINGQKSETERQHYMETLLTSKGETVLNIASLSGKKTMCTHLYQMYPSLILLRDSRGRHCLHDAALSGDVDCFIYLDNLINGQKSETDRLHYMETLLTSEGETVLHIASLSGKKTMCTHLCQMYPSLISQRDSGGRHCLHDAAYSGDVYCFIYKRQFDK